MRFRQEARIGCSILMLGMALSTLSSLTGLNLTGRGDVPTTLMVGALVLGMVFVIGPVMVGSGPWAPLAAIGVGQPRPRPGGCSRSIPSSASTRWPIPSSPWPAPRSCLAASVKAYRPGMRSPANKTPLNLAFTSPG